MTVRHHPLLLVYRGWRPALALFAAGVLVLARAMAPDQGGARVDSYVTYAAVILAVLGAGGYGWAYLTWATASLTVTDGRLVVRKGVPGIRIEQRELLTRRVSRVEVRWPAWAARSGQCADMVIGVAGGRDIRFRLASSPSTARDALLGGASAGPRTAMPVCYHAATQPPAASLPVISPDRFVPANKDVRPTAGSDPQAEGPRTRPIRPVVWRRHIWLPLWQSFGPVAFAVLGPAIVAGAQRLGFQLSTVQAWLAHVIFFSSALIWLLWLWASWWTELIYVRDARLVHRAGWVIGATGRESTHLLEQVDDFAFRIPSPLAFLFDYGDVAVGAAGSAGPAIYRGMRRPGALVRAIREEVVAAQLTKGIGVSTAPPARLAATPPLAADAGMPRGPRRRITRRRGGARRAVRAAR